MSCTDHTGRMLATLAHLAAARTGSEGAVLHHALYAALLAAELHLAPADADDRAADPAWNDAERRINDRARALINAARTAGRRDEFTPATVWTPSCGDVVTHTGTDGTWIVSGHEDDDTVWIHRPDVRTVPTIGRNTATMVDLAGWQDRPEHELLAAVAELRPAEHRQGDEDETADQHRTRTGHLPNFGCCVTDDTAPEKVATISRRPGLRPGSHIYAIAYTVDGQPAGGSLALPHDLEAWKADLAADGWTLVIPEDKDDEQPAADTAQLTPEGAR